MAVVAVVVDRDVVVVAFVDVVVVLVVVEHLGVNFGA